GIVIAKLLAEHFRSIQALAEAKISDLTKIYGIGEEIAQSVYTWFKIPQNNHLIQRLAQAGLQLSLEISKTSQLTPLAGKTFVLTGTLPNLTRNEAKKLIENAGGKVSSAVSAKTDYLVVGENPGSKLAKAKKLGIKQITETELLKLIEAGRV
ncbi:MAG: NAD-dependent DNA ligase LigA, partial [Cyanobacteria bacterium J083]